MNKAPKLELFLFRVIIKVPEHLDQLKRGQLSVNILSEILIQPEAEPDLSTDVKQLARFPCFDLKLNDPYTNSVKLISGRDELRAIFISDDHLILGLPDDYKFYNIFLFHGLNVSDEEIDYILTWRHARSIKIAHAFNSVTVRLAQNVTKLEGMTALAELRFSIDESSYLTVRINNFLNHLPALKTLEFSTVTMPKEDVDLFMLLQGKLIKWNVEYKTEFGGSVLITRKKDRKNPRRLLNDCNLIE